MGLGILPTRLTEGPELGCWRIGVLPGHRAPRKKIEAMLWKPQEGAGLATQTPGSWLGQCAFSGQSPPGLPPIPPPFFFLKLHSIVFPRRVLKALLWKVQCAGGS